MSCLVCNSPMSGGNNLCQTHSLPYQRAWFVSERQGVMRELIDSYKFKRVMSAYKPLARILDTCLPMLPENTLVTPIPTTPSNTRIRGYDHMLLIAKELARIRNLKVECSLVRKNNVTQHFAKSARERRTQAKEFFGVSRSIEQSSPHLVIDDIFTTGATALSATEQLREAGVSDVWLAVIVKQV